MNRYEDIIDLPHHVSQKHPRMSMLNRAAQFSPFAALTGYDAAIRETARQTDRKIELDEGAQAVLDEKLRFLEQIAGEHPVVRLTCFVPDPFKEGGAYVSMTARVKRIDAFARQIVLAEEKAISFADILEMDCEQFHGDGEAAF